MIKQEKTIMDAPKLPPPHPKGHSFRCEAVLHDAPQKPKLLLGRQPFSKAEIINPEPEQTKPLKIDFKELNEIDLNTISEIHALFPHWKKSSVQKKLNNTISSADKRFIALVNGKICAHVKIVFGKGLHKHRAEIFSLIVAPKQRHKRIGFQLMEFALKNLPAKTKLILLEVSSKNTPAINLYKKLGFKKYGFLKKASMINEKFVNNNLMSKEIN